MVKSLTQEILKKNNSQTFITTHTSIESRERERAIVGAVFDRRDKSKTSRRM